MSEQTPYSSLSDDAFVLILKSKSEDHEWKVSDLREVERRGKSILADEPDLEKRFNEYESKLRDKLDDAEAEIDNPSLRSETESVINQLVNISKSPPFDSFTRSQSALDSMKKQAAEISLLVKNVALLNSISASQAAINAMTKQASEIARLATQAVGISLAQSTLEQYSKSTDLINAATRSAAMFAVIPNQLSMFQRKFFDDARREPISLLPQSSDDVEVNQVIASNVYENSARSEVESRKDQVFEIANETIHDVLVGIRDRSDKLIELQEKTNDLVENGSPSKYWVIAGTLIALLALLALFLPLH